jgi:hypothetical protein
MTKRKKNNYKSKCCGAKVRIHSSPDDIDKFSCTMYHVCTNCGQACDIIILTRRTWIRNPKTQIIPNKKKKKSTKLSSKELREIHLNEDF